MKKFLNSFKTRSFRVGGYSVAASIILVAIIVFINVLVNAIPSTYTSLDVSSNQLYSLSDETKQILSNMDEDVTLYWIALEDSKDETVSNLLDRYAGASDHITVKYVDPDVLPTFAQSYGQDSVSNNSIIVEGSLRYKYVASLYDYEYDTSSYNYQTGSYDYTTTFDGENELTSAINYVLNADLPVVYSLTGHGESDLSDTFSEGLSNENMEINELSLITQENVPDDCDVLMIINPTSDISEDEKTAIVDYLDAGGKMMLVTDPPKSERPNLEALMEYYGVKEETGIVMEGDQNNYAARYGAAYILPNIESHTITDPIIDAGYYIFAPVAGALSETEETPENTTVTNLLQTSSSAYVKADGYDMTTMEQEDGDLTGTFGISVLVEKTIDDDNTAQIVWISSATLINDNANTMVNGANLDFFVNSMVYMTGQEDSISIHAKELTYEYLTLTSTETTIWTIVMMAVIPLAFVICGIVIFVRRRRR